MTVLALKVTENEIQIAADSILLHGSTKFNNQNDSGKLFEINNMIIASTGLASHSSLLSIFCRNHKPESADEKHVLDFVSEFCDWVHKRTNNYILNDLRLLLVFEKTAFEIIGGFVQKIETYTSMGAGYIEALTALTLGKTAKEAAEVACQINAYCALPVTVITVKKQDGELK